MGASAGEDWDSFIARMCSLEAQNAELLQKVRQLEAKNAELLNTIGDWQARDQMRISGF